MHECSIVTVAPEETRKLADRLGKLIDAPLTIRLSGPLGAGKTCFAQGLAAGLGVPDEEPVTSPSYTLMNQYRGRLPLYHFDLYRLGHPDDLDDLGFDEYLDGDGVTLIEWADRFGPVAGDGLTVRLAIGDGDRREITLSAVGDTAAGVLRGLTVPGSIVDSGAGEKL